MDTDTYDQFALADDVLGETMSYVRPESTVTMDWFEGKPVGIEIRPRSTSRSSKRRPHQGANRVPRRSPRRSKTELVVQSPRFINEGESCASAPKTATTSGGAT